MTTPVLHGTGLTDVRMMVVAHTNFRRELKLSVPAVRRTAEGDLRRAGEVADHVNLFIEAVTHHHTIEDALLWQPLAARVPDDLAPLVALMEEQHHGVHLRLTEASRLVQRWRGSASSVTRDALAEGGFNRLLQLPVGWWRLQRMPGARLTIEQRRTIGRSYRIGLSQEQIASIIGKHKSTVSRELARSSTAFGSPSPKRSTSRGGGQGYLRSYNAERAQRVAALRARRPIGRRLDVKGQ